MVCPAFPALTVHNVVLMAWASLFHFEALSEESSQTLERVLSEKNCLMSADEKEIRCNACIVRIVRRTLTFGIKKALERSTISSAFPMHVYIC